MKNFLYFAIVAGRDVIRRASDSGTWHCSSLTNELASDNSGFAEAELKYICNMKRLATLAFIVFLLFPLVCGAQKTSAVFSISGITIESGTGEKIPGVAVNLEDTGIWTTSDDNGRFVLTDIRPGTYRLVFSCLGYVDRKLDFTVKADIGSLTIKMNQNSLALNGVTVTAERN